MYKRILKFGTMFIILFIINFMLIINLVHQHSKKNSIQSILTQIDHPDGNPVSAPLVLGVNETTEQQPAKNDWRVANLKSFFRKYNSPLYEYSDLIVQVSDENQLDYRLIPAIAVQESGACKVIPHNSYNCWGYGIYGNTVTRFSSYDEAITTIAKGLKKNYIDNGLTTAPQIMSKYTPSSNGSWAEGVNKVFNWLE